MSKELEFLINVVKEASAMITDDFVVKAKDDKGDLVTNFDYEIEKFISENIEANYPDFSIVSEEFNSGNELTENCFTIDPIDGTVNFAHGVPLWAIQTACIKNGKTCAAVIYVPKLNELYYADENGAYLNGEKIHVNDATPDKGLYIIEGAGSMQGEYKMKSINRHYRDFHCTAIDFAWCAVGRISAVNFVYNSYWDYIPGMYLVEKAGGVTYNAYKNHIAANTKEYLDVMINNSTVDENVQVELVKKRD